MYPGSESYWKLGGFWCNSLAASRCELAAAESSSPPIVVGLVAAQPPDALVGWDGARDKQFCWWGEEFCAGSASMSQSCVSAKPGKSGAGLQVGLSPLGREVDTPDPTNASAGGEWACGCLNGYGRAAQLWWVVQQRFTTCKHWSLVLSSQPSQKQRVLCAVSWECWKSTICII